MNYTQKDIRAEKNGDIPIQNGDIVLASPKQTTEQMVNRRMRTNNPDWFNNYNIGADLEDLRGMKNTRETAELGRAKIIQCLTYDDRFHESDLNIEFAPTGVDEITYYIRISLGHNEELTIVYPVNTAT